MRNFFLILVLFVAFSQNGFSQNFNKIFWNMSFKDKVWIISNFNSSFKAKKISKQIIILSNNNCLDFDYKEGELDAFRHILLMYKLSSQIGVEKARHFGNIYENYNKRIFYEEPNSGYDRAGEWMDKFNNEIGIYVFLKIGKVSDEKVFQEIDYQIKKGYARKIKTDSKGNSLNIDNKVIERDIWMKNWINERVLIQSND